jgi:hypothetical protein
VTFASRGVGARAFGFETIGNVQEALAKASREKEVARKVADSVKDAKF